MAQINMIEIMINRERDRIVAAMVKEPDSTLRNVGNLAYKLTPASVTKVATAYYQAC